MITVLGGSGYVGSAIVQRLEQRGLPYHRLSRQQVGPLEPDQLTETLKDLGSTFVLNSAGYTGKPNVDACETDKTECVRGNVILPGVLRECCERLGIPLGHVSSGCIFTGAHNDGSGFRESDPPNFCFRTDNCSFYSGTKALGEEVLAGSEQCYVWRLRIPFNERDGARNYLSKVQRYDRLLQATNSLSHLDEFAAACVQSWEQRIPFGIYNVTNGGSVTTRQVCDLIERHRPREKPFEFFEDENEFMKKAAVTPRSNCVMDNSKILSTGIQLRPIEEALEHSIRNWVPENVVTT